MTESTGPDERDEETIDLEALGLSHMARHARTATFAGNWRTVLLADASVGLVVLIAGLLIMLLWISWIGIAVMIVGAAYILMVGRRFLQWRWLRREVGL